MQGVMANACSRADVLLRRGCANVFGARWSERIPGEGVVEKDLSEWSGALEMSYAGESVYTQQCVTTMRGLCYADVPDTAFSSSEWDGRASGDYRITATDPEGTTHAVIEGVWHMG